MSILRNVDVAKKIGISPATVKNWIEYALTDKIILDLTKIGDRYYIDDNVENINRLNKLKNQGAKFRSKNEWLKISPEPRFYEIFTDSQIIDIMNHIEYHNFVPVHYFRQKEGSKWRYETQMDLLESNPKFNKAISKIAGNLAEIVTKIEQDGKKANIIELGSDIGTIFCEDLIKSCVDKGILKNYISVSTSGEIHKLRRAYVKNYHKFSIIEEDCNIEEQSIKHIINHYSDQETVNICMMVYGSINTIPNVIQVIGQLSNSIRPGIDFLAIDTDMNVQSSSFNLFKEASDMVTIHNTYKWLLEILGFFKNSELKCDIIEDHHDVLNSRYLSLNINVEYSYNYKGEVKKFKLPRDFRLYYMILRRFSHGNLLKLFESANLNIERYYFTNDDNSGLFILTPNAIV